MAERAHLSIGEVLSLLREEFPDVTISKIRFLESQGLLDPERTPSGYRKFYEEDVDRLRWILRQQRENFLPLKVIKGRLTDHGEAAVVPIPDAAAEMAAPSPVLAAAGGEHRDGRLHCQLHPGGTGAGHRIDRAGHRRAGRLRSDRQP